MGAYGPAEIAGVLAVVAFASSISRVSGFGFGLIVVPVMSLFIKPQEAIIISTVVGLFTSMNQAWWERRNADPEVVHRLFLSACVGMPPGLAVFLFIPEKGLRLVLGVVVMLAAFVLARGFVLPRASKRTDMGIGFLSGVLNTSVSTNGPPLVFLLQARGYEPHMFRGTISRVFFYSNVVSVSLFAWAGKLHGRAVWLALCALPLMYLMQWGSGHLAHHVHGDRFRRLVLALLFLSGVSAVVAAAAK